MKRRAPFVLFALLLACAMAAMADDPYATGQSLAAVQWIDDHGALHSTEEWRGAPLLIAPVFTRCPLACPMIMKGLRRGVGEATARPDSYRVVVFSFDPRDTPADLRRFRETQNIPIAWTVATAKRDDIRALMDSIGFRYAEVKGGFAHPNVLVAVTPALKTAKYLFGTSYSGGDIDGALAVARGASDWLNRYAGWLLALLIFVCTASGAYLVTTIARVRRAASQLPLVH